MKARGFCASGSINVTMPSNINNDDLNVRNLAKALATSESSLRRRLQEFAGVTPLDPIRNERLRNAHNLIIAGKVKSVSDAAQSVGFLNAGHFSRLYAEAYGESPKVHLKHYRSKGSQEA